MRETPDTGDSVTVLKTGKTQNGEDVRCQMSDIRIQSSDPHLNSEF